jgi:hypothetical protein
MTSDEFKSEMERISQSDDGTSSDPHIAADELMCDLLESLGYGKGVEIFRSITRWYE